MKHNAPDLSAYVDTPALVIDDDRLSRELIIDLLRELGFRNIREINSSNAAIQFLNEQKDWRGIIFCDWNMPNMTGLELYHSIRQSHPDLPFIMVTGRNDEESITHAKDSGIYAYILKPFSLTELERKVTKVTMNHSAFLLSAHPPAPKVVLENCPI